MRRRFILSQDNAPITTIPSIEFTASTGTNEVFYETGTRVSWAIITTSNVNLSTEESLSGPFYNTSDGSTIYNIRDFSGVGASDEYSPLGLQIYLNGQLLTRDVEYEEINDGGDYYRFQFIDIATTGLPELPDGDQLSIIFSEPTSSGSLVGSENVYISGLYPTVSTGFNIGYSGFSGGETVSLQVVYS